MGRFKRYKNHIRRNYIKYKNRWFKKRFSLTDSNAKRCPSDGFISLFGFFPSLPFPSFRLFGLRQPSQIHKNFDFLRWLSQIENSKETYDMYRRQAFHSPLPYDMYRRQVNLRLWFGKFRNACEPFWMSTSNKGKHRTYRAGDCSDGLYYGSC